MLLDHYVSAMDSWKGRIDSETDYDAFRWHQWVQPIDLNDGSAPFTGKLGFAFIGFCSDKGVARNKGRTGTALAPDFVRGQMSGLPCTFSQEVKLYDAGDIICDEISLEEGQRELGCAVEEILRRNLFPIVLGGGHETTFGHFQGQHNFLKDKGKTPELGIVNFDAHFDLRPYDMGNSSGTMFRQMADVCKAEGTPYHYFPIGIQQHSNTVSLFKKAEELGVDYVLAKDLQASNLESILERMDQFLYQCDDTYITVCSDVFSSAFAPGVSAPQSLGLDPEIVLADEPTGALDSKNARSLMEKLSGLNADAGTTILMVTHDCNAASYCKRILFIQDGVLFHELRRDVPDETQQAFYGRILAVMAQLGGGSVNVL